MWTAVSEAMGFVAVAVFAIGGGWLVFHGLGRFARWHDDQPDHGAIVRRNRKDHDR